MTPGQIAVLMQFGINDQETVEVRWEQKDLNPLAQAELIDPATGKLLPRGQAFVDHLCSIGLPEQVTVWRVPGAAEPFLPPLYRVNQVSGSVMYVEEGQPPPRAAAATALPRGDIPTDPEQLRLAVLSHLNNGFGEGETAERFGLTRKEVSTYFDAG